MASEYFNSINGYSIGIPPIPVVDSNGNIVTNVLTTGNVAASNVYASNYFFSNGQPFTTNVKVAGSNTQVQFNDLGNLGASVNLTFDKTSNVLTTTNLDINNNILLKDQSTIEFEDSVSNNVISFKAPANVPNNVDYTLPSTDGNTYGNLLATDTNGNLFWSGYSTTLKVYGRNNIINVGLKNGFLNVLSRTGNIYVQVE